MNLNDLQFAFFHRFSRPGKTVMVASDADIQSGVATAILPFKRWTLFINASGAVEITLELSPDEGETWYTVQDGPISFASAGDKVIEFGYDATHIRLSGNNSSSVTAHIRGVQ